MYYELWDVEIGNGLARYRDERAMAALVRTLVSNYGDGHADDLDLTIEDESGAVLDSLSGAPLIQWADAVVEPTGASQVTAPPCHSESAQGSLASAHDPRHSERM